MSSRPRIALFSPVNPKQSGISDYTEKLIPYLSPHFNIHLYLDGYNPSNDSLSEHVTVHHRRDYEWQRRLTPYRLNIYQIGNNSQHQYIYPVMFRYPGLVFLHEINIHRARAFELLNNRQVNAYRNEMEYCHGDMGSQVANLVYRGFQSELIYDWYPMLKLVCDAAGHIAVHNDYSRTAVEEFMDARDVSVVPAPLIDTQWPQRDAARETLNINSETLIIAAFGFVAPGKGLESAIKSFLRLSEIRPDAQFLMVGKCLDPEYQNALMSQVPESHQARVIITGFVSDDTFLSYLMAADICVNLRYPSQGEASSSLLRIMGAGKPVLIPWYRQFKEIPRDACIHIPLAPNEDDAVVEALMMLSENSTRATQIGEKAREYVRVNNGITQWGNACINLIRSMVDSGFSRKSLSQRCSLPHIRCMPVTEQLAGIFASWGQAADNDLVLETLQKTIKELHLDD